MIVIFPDISLIPFEIKTIEEGEYKWIIRGRYENENYDRLELFDDGEMEKYLPETLGILSDPTQCFKFQDHYYIYHPITLRVVYVSKRNPIKVIFDTIFPYDHYEDD